MPRLAAAVLLAAALSGQEWTLASRVPAPSLYVAVQAPFARKLLEVWPTSAPARLLAGETGASELALLARLCELCSSTIEIAFDAGERAVAVHCVLPAAANERVEALIAAGALLRPVPAEGGVAVYTLAEGTVPAAPPLFLGLADRHLCVASTPAAVTRLLGKEPAPAQTLADDADFRELSRRVEADRPALTLFGSFARLGGLITAAAGEAAPALDLSGFDDASSLLVSVRPRGESLLASLLVRRRPGRPLDGWLAMTDRAPIATLLADLPPAGVASLTLAVDPKALRAANPGPVLGALSRGFAGGCNHLGLELEQQVLQKLKGSAAVQLLLSGSGESVGSAWLAKMKSERDAQRVYADCRRVLVARAASRAVPHQFGEELILPALGPLADGARLGVVRDNLVLGSARGVVEQVAAADRSPDSTSRVDPRWLQGALRALSGGSRQNNVAGLLVVDLTGFLPESARTSALRRHAGLLRVHPDHLRIELFTEL